MKKSLTFLLCWSLAMLCSCATDETNAPSSSSTQVKGEYLYRHHDEQQFRPAPPLLVSRPLYPWEDESKPGRYPKITKEFFRCKGNTLNPAHPVQKGDAPIQDCGGFQRHSLPLREGKEFMYPVLIDVLNYIQTKTGKRVVITSGHCCPDHQRYIDPTVPNNTAKHPIGAEVDFYVQGFEESPQHIIELVMAYYKETPKYAGLKDYLEFKRYDKGNTNVITLPWYNKELFIKLVKKNEGRDFDNRHSYPYVTLQVRHDWDLNKNVTFSPDEAFRNYHRW